MKIKNTLFLVIALIMQFSYAQENKIASVIQLDEFVNTSKTSSKTNKPLRIESLINNLQSATYLEFDGVKTYGAKPICLFSSSKNISNVKSFKFDKENIEIINIRINTFDDLKSTIDCSLFSDFKKLKYIYIISDIKCNEIDINPIIKNVGNYIILFKIADNS